MGPPLGGVRRLLPVPPHQFEDPAFAAVADDGGILGRGDRVGAAHNFHQSSGLPPSATYSRMSWSVDESFANRPHIRATLCFRSGAILSIGGGTPGYRGPERGCFVRRSAFNRDMERWRSILFERVVFTAVQLESACNREVSELMACPPIAGPVAPFVGAALSRCDGTRTAGVDNSIGGRIVGSLDGFKL